MTFLYTSTPLMDASYQKSAPENLKYLDSSEILFNQKWKPLIFLTTIENLSYNNVLIPISPNTTSIRRFSLSPLLSLEALYAIGKDHY